MQLDAAEVGDPGETRRIRDHGKVRLVTGGVADVHGFEPIRMWHRHSLLIEEVALDAVRMPLHLHRASRDVMQHGIGDVDVILNEIALGQPHLREEDLLDVGDLDLAAGNEHAGQL